MRKFFAKLSSFIIAAAIAGLSFQPVFASGKVTYVGEPQKFIFSPGSAYSVSDLFSGLKNALPGDSLSDEIEVSNGLSDMSVRLYMRSLGAQNETEDLLNQLILRVAQDGKTLFDSESDKPAQLSDWTYLGVYDPGEKTVLELYLEIPVTLGNEYQSMAGFIDWEFLAEEIPPDEPLPPGPNPPQPPGPNPPIPDDPDDPGSDVPGSGNSDDPVDPGDPSGPRDPDKPDPWHGDTPKTGDETRFGLYASVGAVSTLVLLLLLIFTKKREDEEENEN